MQSTESEMYRYILILIVTLLIPVSGLTQIFHPGVVETHLGGGLSLYAPIHHQSMSLGYALSLTMRPEYARNIIDGLERWNLGFTVQSINHVMESGEVFRDAGFTLRYYLTENKCGLDWESYFIGGGLGVATYQWEGGGITHKHKNLDYLLELGYEADMRRPLVFVFSANARLASRESISFTGIGISISIAYGVGE